jgi:ABC-type multidrug transport system permease subunit
VVIDQYNHDHPMRGPDFDAFQEPFSLQQARCQRQKSPYTLSYWQQIRLCFWRGYNRMIADPVLLITSVISNIAIVLIVSSIFYNLPMTTSSFYSRGALLFFAILINAFSSQLEILTLYAQRPCVEKHARYALYHPSAEALASMLTDLPIKAVNLTCFNGVLYWMTGLNKDAGAFFFFLLTSFMMVLVMSSLFRTIASLSRTLTQALAPVTILVLALVIYSGFVIPLPYMHGWARWINYLDPIAYGLEALMVNEFHGHNYT